MNAAIIWDMAPRSSYVSRSFGGKNKYLIQGRKLIEEETIVQQVAA
jgi:hypothetical protein